MRKGVWGPAVAVLSVQAPFVSRNWKQCVCFEPARQLPAIQRQQAASDATKVAHQDCVWQSSVKALCAWSSSGLAAYTGTHTMTCGFWEQASGHGELVALR